MKRVISVAFIIAMLCSLSLLIVIAPVNASAAGYQHTTVSLTNTVTLDGKWTAANEYTDSALTNFGAGLNTIFMSKWFLASLDPITVYQYIIIEILNDNTNDTGDYWQLCFDGDESGGSAPQSGDLRIDINGHTSLTAYQGSGTGWNTVSAPSTFQWRNSIDTSMWSSTPHWICEIIIDKVNFGIGADYWMRLAVFDASNAAAGVRAWPPTSRDVPNDWGDIAYTSEAIPEGSSFAVVALLSSVAVAVGFFSLRKRLRINKWP